MNKNLIQLKRENGLSREALQFYEMCRRGEIMAKVFVSMFFGLVLMMPVVLEQESNWSLIAFGITGLFMMIATIVATKLGYNLLYGLLNVTDSYVEQYLKLCELFEMSPQQFSELTDQERARRAEKIRNSLKETKAQVDASLGHRNIEEALKILDRMGAV